MAQIMLEKAVLITDTTRYLEENYGEHDLVMFRLEERQMLPKRIRRLLAEPDERQLIAENGWRRTIVTNIFRRYSNEIKIGFFYACITFIGRLRHISCKSPKNICTGSPAA